MATVIRFRIPNELRRVRNCIIHTEKRAMERFGVEFSEYDQCLVIDKIQSGELKSFARESTSCVWVKFKLGGKTCFALYNEALEVFQTLYSNRMIERLRTTRLAA